MYPRNRAKKEGRRLGLGVSTCQRTCSEQRRGDEGTTIMVLDTNAMVLHLSMPHTRSKATPAELQHQNASIRLASRSPALPVVERVLLASMRHR